MKKKTKKQPMHKMPDGSMMPGKSHKGKKPAKKISKGYY
jgi:hypothetical protein